MNRIAIVGAGFIGRAWAIVFARSGFEVQIWDKAEGAVAASRDFIAERLPELAAAGLITEAPDAILARLHPCATLEAALEAVTYVQENGPERVDAKAELFARMDEIAPKEVILASSTSGIPASAFTESLRGRHRCLVAHPVNPPYLVPVVELCPAPWTAGETVDRTRTLMQRAGMVPATVKREVPGFVLNRLQVALVAEAFRLVADGVVTPADLDATIKHGLGLRWAFMGPFETIDLNAPGGVEDYCARYGGLYDEVQKAMTPLSLTRELVETVTEARRAALPLAEHPGRQAWRDKMLMGLLAHKRRVGEGTAS